MNASMRTIQEYWDARPCGSFEPPGKLPPPAHFRAYERIRYERQPEIAAFADFEHWRRRQVLEIGVGIGGDFVRFGRAGASAVGLDLSIRSLALARQNAEINHVVPTLLNADALAISLRLCVALPELSEKLTRV